jgi:hypothetical protein
MTPHVPIPRRLRVEPEYEGAIAYLRFIDPDLRLRKSAECAHLYILERRCRRAPATNTGMRDLSDMHIQARDGYIHVSGVHPAWLLKPWNMVRALKEEGTDLWAAGGAQQVASEMEYEERWAKETRRRRRLGIYRDVVKDAYDPMQRMNKGGERSRISNVGVQPLSHAPTLGSAHAAA